jgi:hypothetical protein
VTVPVPSVWIGPSGTGTLWEHVALVAREANSTMAMVRPRVLMIVPSSHRRRGAGGQVAQVQAGVQAAPGWHLHAEPHLQAAPQAQAIPLLSRASAVADEVESGIVAATFIGYSMDE